MKPAVTISDPEREVVAILTASLGAGIVSTDYPSTSLSGSTKKVQVDLESGDVSDYPITERAQVRVVAHAARGRRTEVKAYADTLRRILYTYGGSATVAMVKPTVGRSAVSTDPDTGNVMCWLLVRVDLKATPAS